MRSKEEKLAITQHLEGDPLAEAEKGFGHMGVSNNVDAAVFLSIASRMGNSKTSALIATHDTHMGMLYQDLLNSLEAGDHGFKFKHLLTLPILGGMQEVEEEQFWMDRTRGILIHIESYSDKKSINMIYLYFCVDFTEEGRKALRGLNYSFHSPTQVTSDARDGMYHKLLCIEEAQPETKWIVPWNSAKTGKSSLMNFGDYKHPRYKDKSWEERSAFIDETTANKVKQFPTWAQDIFNK